MNRYKYEIFNQIEELSDEREVHRREKKINNERKIAKKQKTLRDESLTTDNTFLNC